MTAEVEGERAALRPPDLDGPDAGDGDGGGSGSSGVRQALDVVRETVQLIVVALVLAFIIKSLAVQAFFIPSGSMLQTLHLGDRVLVEKISYRFGEVERGDIIVFRRPGLEPEGFSVGEQWTSFLEGIGLREPDPDRDLIKRVIGLPGETVEIVGGTVLVDGEALDEPYAAAESRDFPAVTVPEGEFFVLGDNRGNSLDSRFTLGTVPEENVIGRAFATIWPLSEATLDMGAEYPGVDPAPGAPAADPTE